MLARAGVMEGDGGTEKDRLAEARQIVKQQAFYMKRALDQRNVREALKHASSMLGELRTSALGPKAYYDLYISATDELRHMESYISSEHKRGRRMLELYELVQHAGNVLPRLYLLLTVGSVYIVSKEAAAKDILTDLVEMCRGVQHPMRGLFLRNYLAQASKSKLPDTGSEYEGDGGSVSDAVAFILSNFGEMNKLWVRMQHQGPVRERESREKERMDLRILVGTNLAQLSKLEGVDLALYQNLVLPQVLEQIVNCKDAIAQGYLMECLTQVFPVEFHTATLATWLQHTAWLSAGCDLKALLIGMLERLQSVGPAADAEEGAEVAQAADNAAPFHLIQAHLATLHPSDAGESATPTGASGAGGSGSFEPLALLELYEALLGFALAAYPTKLDLIEETLASALALLNSAPQGLCSTNPKGSAVLLRLVTRPVEHLSAVLSVLALSSWPPLLAHLSHAKQKDVAAVLVGAVIAQGVTVTTSTDAGKLLAFVQPLMTDDPSTVVDTDAARPDALDEDDAAELGPVARLIHAFSSPNTDDQCRILNAAHRQAINGSQRRSPFALVPIVFSCLSLVRSIKLRVDGGETVEVGVHKLLSFVATMVATLKPLAPSLTLRLHLLASSVADSVGEEGDAYEFMTQAFTTYEEDISDSRAQLAAVTLASATLHHTSVFSEDSYATLATQTTQYSARLLKKPDQCRAVTKAALLFAPTSRIAKSKPIPTAAAVGEEGEEAGEAGEADETPLAASREPKRVLECLQRALKIADACKVSSMHTPLFVEILDAYLYHYGASNPAVLPSYISSLLQLIEQQLTEEADSKSTAIARPHFENCKNFVAGKRVIDSRFAEIE